MYERPERTRGIVLDILDLSMVEDDALAKAKQDRPEDGLVALKAGFGPYAVADTARGMFVICNEGVGWEVSDEKPLRVELFGEYDGKFDAMASEVVELTPAQVRAFTSTTDRIDLADLIRVFGDRLERNFNLWHATISEATRDTTVYEVVDTAMGEVRISGNRHEVTIETALSTYTIFTDEARDLGQAILKVANR